ncbi:MAG TPA: anthranilate synthase component I [Thermoleophilaceae bacterium]|nr:anthranilate synthase component I [Thermoleophilaceae bacterium]
MAVAAEGLRVTPSLEQTRELAREHTLVPLRHTFIDDCETPVSAYLKLRGDGPSFLLESAEQGQRFGRWSFLGFRPRTVLRLDDGVLTANGEERAYEDPYSAVSEELDRYRIAPLDGLPPFAGGAVGLFGYDLVRHAEPTVGPANPDELGTPDMALMVSDVLVAFDHLRHEVTILANVFAGDDLDRAHADAVAAIAEVRERLAAPVPRARAGTREVPAFQSNMGADGYAGAVERCKEYIRAGDAYQVVPSQRWSADAPVDAFSIYRGLRAINPSPYMYFLDFEDFEIAGASPESLVKVTGRRAEQRPIAGTRPRADTAEQDIRRAEELLADEKERAEHVMLVDLARNDLGRVCEYGTVKVDELMAVETYSHVLHIVSSVSGTLREGVSAMDALEASLPAGTLSGAPKIRAMQIIDELEPVKRGPYGGAVGYLSYTGELDTCIFIRSAVVKDGRVHAQAGGGIVADSDAAYEQRETEAKAGAVFGAIELACRQVDWE